MMLLIACANVAHLLLGQAAGRVSEMSTRMALGAARGRLIRQVLAETLVIAVPGGLLGVVAGGVGRPGTGCRAASGDCHASTRSPWIMSVLAFTCGVTLADRVRSSGSARRSSSRGSVDRCKRSRDRRTTAARSVRRWHHAIVVGELAMAQVLLIGAGLLLASFVAAQRVPLGFESTGRVAADLTLASQRYLRPISRGRTAHRHHAEAAVREQRARARPERSRRARRRGVIHLASHRRAKSRDLHRRPASQGPRLGGHGGFSGRDHRTSSAPSAQRWLRGRDFDEHDGANAPRVAVVNDSLREEVLSGARSDWPPGVVWRRPRPRDRRCGRRHALPLRRIASRPDVLSADYDRTRNAGRFSRSRCGATVKPRRQSDSCEPPFARPIHNRR